MDMITAAYAANKVKADLAASGQIGSFGELQPVVLLPETEVSFGMDGDLRMSGGVLEVGKTYIVGWQGDEYTLVCFDGSEFGNLNDGWAYIASLDPETGWYSTPFCVCDNGETLYIYDATFQLSAATVSLAVLTKTIRTIDPKYLPDDTAEINLADYGIDIATLVLAGGGKTEWIELGDKAEMLKIALSAKKIRVIAPVESLGATIVFNAISTLLYGGVIPYLHCQAVVPDMSSETGDSHILVKLVLDFASISDGSYRSLKASAYVTPLTLQEA